MTTPLAPGALRADDRPRLLMVMPYRQFVRKAQAEGFWVGAIWDPRLETPDYLDDVRAAADLFVTVDFRDEELLRRTIREVAAEHHVSVIHHLGREETMVAAHEVAEELHAEVNPATAVRCLADKLAMRELLARHELSPVAYESAPTRHEVPAAVERIGLPAVVKPVALAGSRGVFLWREPRDLADWTALVDSYGYDGPFLVEEYLSGPEYSVETLSQDGGHRVVGTTEKLLGAPPLFVEVGHVHPAPLPTDRRQAIEELAVRFLTVCGYRFGPAHTEVIWTARGPRIVESQARLGGDRIPRLVELAGGLDIERAVFAGLAGTPVEVPEPTATAAVRFFTFPPGRVEAVHGLQRVQALPYVDELRLRLRPGDTVTEVRDSKGRHGHVIVSGATPEETRSRCAEVLATLQLVIDGTTVRADGRAEEPRAVPDDDAQVVFVGYNAAYLRAIDGSVPAGSVVVLEEPDIIRKRELRDAAARFACLDRIVPAHYQQSAGALDLVAELEAERPVAAVVPGLEYAVPAAAALAEKLGLPGATESAAQALRDKVRLREVCDAGGVRGPRWREVHGPEDIIDFAAEGPVVVKPANRQASVGVQLLDSVDAASAARAWERTSSAAEYEQVPDRHLRWRFLAEERLRGPEFSVEALVRQGEIIFHNITAKTVIPGPYPVELGHLLPAPVDRDTQGAFEAAMRALVAATGYRTGILHAEWILTASGPALVECAGRCPGDYLIDLNDLAYGTRIRVALIDLLAGRPVSLPRTAHLTSAIRFLAAEPGTVTEVAGTDAARALPGVRTVEVDVEAGQEVRPWASSWDRAGHVIATGPDADSARRRVLDADAAIRITTE
ncbi:ATP-grasp domain-containing protein [Streptomyces sp. KL118A]|uniref:ATP-grasp domain-containing protein n=1 Tax=Streptomyces sp. KL118A TaxID=3045153 RepID=UPI00278C23C3|nr:ATP-grasp domain-containing protein [Streptomyces sp. KL118A]